MATTTRRPYNTQAPPSCGFDIMSDALTDHFHKYHTSSKTITGVVNTAHKHLKTAFHASIKGVASSQSGTTTEAASVTPSVTRRSASHVTPVTFPTLDDADDEPECSIQQRHRLDQQYAKVSCGNQAMRRLRISELVRIGYREDFIVYIPPTNKNDPQPLRKAYDDAREKMKNMVLYDHKKNTTTAERDLYWERELKTRGVKKYGGVGHEFHVRVHAYPERARLEMDPIPNSEMKHLLLPETGVGITLQLLGYSPTASTLFKLYSKLLQSVPPK